MKFKLTALFALAAGMAFAIPAEPLVVLGLLRDPFGAQYVDGQNAKVQAVNRNGKVLAECNLGTEQFGQYALNYRMTIEIDAGTAPQRANAAVLGETLTLKVWVGGEEQNIIPAGSATLTVPANRTDSVRLDLATGKDEDNDGIPDEWEEMMIASNRRYGEAGMPTTPAEFDPNADYDGDGFSNLREFQVGTNPFDATEVFRITEFKSVPENPNVMALTFTTTPERNYTLFVTDELKKPIVWLPAQSCAAPDGVMGVAAYKGDGYSRTVFVPRGLTEQKGVFYSVAVE